ncbi:hypothetical protein KI387_001842, partial [Taxus chinensis]
GTAKGGGRRGDTAAKGIQKRMQIVVTQAQKSAIKLFNWNVQLQEKLVENKHDIEHSQQIDSHSGWQD